MIESGTVLTSSTRFAIENVSLMLSLRFASLLLLFSLFEQELNNSPDTNAEINNVDFFIFIVC